MDIRNDANDNNYLSPSNASPPDLDFDFNLPCRFFKSSFARSLSLNNANTNGSNNQCKSLDYDMRSNNSHNNNKLSCLKRDMTAVSPVPPLPQRSINQAGSFYQQNEANLTNEQKQVFADTAAETVAYEEEKPPALPARRPLSLHNLTLSQNLSGNECQMNAEQKFQQNVLTQLRQQAYKQATNNSNKNSKMPVNGYNNNNNTNNGYNCKSYADHTIGLQLSPQQQQEQQEQQPTLNQKPQPHHFTATSNKNASNSDSNNCNSNSVNENGGKKANFRRNNNNNNHIVWSNQQKNVEQDYNSCTYDHTNVEDIESDELNSNYHDKAKLSNNNYNKHFHNSHQMLYTMPVMNIHSNHLQQQQQQQNQQQHQTPSYEIINDNSTNVEALILQNQVDTLQWQLKQMETSCDMYRAVMEEVARFLERYQSQKQFQQQQKLQMQQQQQHVATQKHFKNNNGKVEQIPRSKSLFQVYIAGGHEKSTAENNDLDDTTLKSTSATSYQRARSSTNLIDLKQQPSKSSGKNKDEHIFEPSLAPSQSYSAFKDFTWRRSPKKTDSRLNTAKDDEEEKLNKEAFRLLRTIQNLLNTSQLQPDFTHHRLSLGPTAVKQMGRLSKAMSTTSVITLPGQPMLNSTNLTMDTNSNGSLTPDSSNTSPTTSTTANNAASNNLAPEMLFLRSANMRDSRLSLRSSTDSSVHSTSSAASSASSKVETDEEPSTRFHSAPNILSHKQHPHLTGSSTEDESGFSSISSFPDIGVPLNSTLLSNSSSCGKSRLIGKELKSLKGNENDSSNLAVDSRNSTLKANVVGLPLCSPQDMSHRWDSPSKTYHSASSKFQKFSALTNEDSNAVLWV